MFLKIIKSFYMCNKILMLWVMAPKVFIHPDVMVEECGRIIFIQKKK